MENNEILLCIKNVDKYYLMNSLLKRNINYIYVRESANAKYIKVSYKNYSKIKAIFDETVIIKYYGRMGIKKFIRENYIFLASLLWGFILLIILSNTIFNIEVNTDNEDIKYKLETELERVKIKKYSFKKSYKEISNIKREILNNNLDTIEWLEIKNMGTKYTVELTPRVIIREDSKSNTPRHIIARKDALIKHIESTSGDIIRDVNDYVKKGEIIISGNIIKGENTIKNQVHASGKVYGEVWYTVKTTIPYSYTEYIPTGKEVRHYYLEAFGDKMTLIGKYDTEYSINETKTIIDKPYLFFKVVRELKKIYTYKEFNVTKDEAYKEGIKRSDKGIQNKLNENEYIIDKKVLNINPLRSKIELEIFYKVYENITDTLLIEGNKLNEEGIN